MKHGVFRLLNLLLCAVLMCSFLFGSVVSAEETPVQNVLRLAGDNRLVTSYLVADQLKETLGVEKFDSVIVASGATFADALPGTYLSAVKNAPILLTLPSPVYENQTKSYIKSVLKPGGTIYILGGVNAVPASMETGFGDYHVKRVSGSNRFLTNLEILKEAGVKAQEEILVCTATGYADSLSASATGKPILLVHNKLTDEQKSYLSTLSGVSFCVIGGENAVSNKIMSELSAYGSVIRLAGKDRLDTSVMVTQRYFENADSAVVCYGWNFPDGLCGGSLAYAMNAPLLLTHSNQPLYSFTASYTNPAQICRGYVLGGSGLVSDQAVQAIFAKDLKDITTVSKAKGYVELSASSAIVPPLTDYAIHVNMNVSGGELSAASSDESVATAVISDNKLIIIPGGTMGSAVITVTSSETDYYTAASATCNVTIAGSNLTVSASGYEGTYDGSSHGITVSCDGANITYSVSESGTYRAALPTFTDAGTYTVFYKAEKEGYATFFGSEKVIIHKADSSLTLSEETARLGYCGSIDIAASRPGDGELTAVSSNPSVASVSLSGTTVTVTALEEGQATITISLSEGTNYLAHSGKTVEITVEFEDNVLTVGEGKMYSTIQAAVDAAADGDVVLVYPGTYTEAVDVTTKTISLHGTDKDSCILTYPNGDYYYPPLEMASGELKDLTIIATAQKQLSGAVAKAYCLHTDYSILEGKTFYIENVDFINADYQAVGIGLRGNSTLEFVNCSFICEVNNSAFFCHDHVEMAKNQCLVVRNCNFSSSGSSYTIQIQSIEQAGSTVFATWIDNTVTNNIYRSRLINMSFYNASSGGSNWLNSAIWTLTPDSKGNSLNALNYE